MVLAFSSCTKRSAGLCGFKIRDVAGRDLKSRPTEICGFAIRSVAVFWAKQQKLKSNNRSNEGVNFIGLVFERCVCFGLKSN